MYEEPVLSEDIIAKIHLIASDNGVKKMIQEDGGNNWYIEVPLNSALIDGVEYIINDNRIFVDKRGE